jgi:hypothetical protein
VQLGCNKSSRGFRKAPRVAIGAVKLQLVTSGCWTVTAEGRGLEFDLPVISLPPQFAWPVLPDLEEAHLAAKNLS